MKDRKNRIRLIIVIIFVIFSIGLTVLAFPVINGLRTEAGRVKIVDAVDSLGFFGFVFFILLQAVQIVVALIPGEPVELLGGVLFGSIWGLIFCLIGVLLGSAIVFQLTKRIGKPLVYSVVSEEKIKKYEFLNDEKRLELIVFILFFIPGTPKDVLTYFVPLTNMKQSKFYLYSTLARIPSVVSSTIVGSSLQKGNWLMSILIFAITGALGLCGILLNDRITRRKDIKKEKKAEKSNDSTNQGKK